MKKEKTYKAEVYAKDLFNRWLLTTDWRVINVNADKV